MEVRAHEKLVEQNAERVHVVAVIYFLATRLYWGEIERCANDVARSSQR